MRLKNDYTNYNDRYSFSIDFVKCDDNIFDYCESDDNIKEFTDSIYFT